MLLSRIVDVSREVAATRSRLRKRAHLSECLREAASTEVGLIVSYLTGHLPQGRIGLGPAIVRELAGAAAAVQATLTLADVNASSDLSLRSTFTGRRTNSFGGAVLLEGKYEIAAMSGVGIAYTVQMSPI